jgi:hypothetical protein
VKLDQTYESLDILSLKIFQKDIYRLFDADYGVIVGRVLGTGIGIPNCRISVFVPIDENEEIIPTSLDDIKKIEALALYPYQTVYDKDSSGKVYNLLPKYAKNRNVNGFPDNEFGIGATPITPVGTFPEKEEILVNETVAYVYDKYLRYTTVTNESGDYILTVPSNRNYVVTMCCDITDIGRFSTTAALLKLDGYSENYFNETGTLINEEIPLERLPNIDIQNLPIYVNPLWSQNQENTSVGINRIDFNITKKIRPFSTVIGNYFTQNNSAWWGDRIVFRALIGLRSLCVTILGSCKPNNTNTWITVWFALQFKICVDYGVGVFSVTILDWTYNTSPNAINCNDFRMCLGLRIKYIVPFFNFLFFQKRYCTLRGGKTNSEPWDLRLKLAAECTRDRALALLGGEITDTLFLDKHKRGDIDIKVMSIKNTVPDAICDTLNNLSPDNTTISTQYDTDSDIELLQSNKYIKYINDGNFVVLLPPNRKKVITNEEGDLIEVDPNSDIGIFTQFRGYFLLSHKEEPDNPPTRDRTARIKLKIPQYFDYNINPITWIWKHFTFDFGEIYSVAQYNEVRKATFDQNQESGDDDMLKPGKLKGWDEQTNILFTGGFNQGNNNVSYNRNNNADLEYTSFYNHLTYLGIDGNLDGIDNGDFDDNTEPTATQPTNKPSFVGFYRIHEDSANWDNGNYAVKGLNIYNYGVTHPNDYVNLFITVLLDASYVSTTNDLWDFQIKANTTQLSEFQNRFLDVELLGPNNDCLVSIQNLAPYRNYEIGGSAPYKVKYFQVRFDPINFKNWFSFTNHNEITQWSFIVGKASDSTTQYTTTFFSNYNIIMPPTYHGPVNTPLAIKFYQSDSTPPVSDIIPSKEKLGINIYNMIENNKDTYQLTLTIELDKNFVVDSIGEVFDDKDWSFRIKISDPSQKTDFNSYGYNLLDSDGNEDVNGEYLVVNNEVDNSNVINYFTTYIDGKLVFVFRILAFNLYYFKEWHQNIPAGSSDPTTTDWKIETIINANSERGSDSTTFYSGTFQTYYGSSADNNFLTV